MTYLTYRNWLLFSGVLGIAYGGFYLLFPKVALELNEFTFALQPEILEQVIGATLIAVGLLLLVISEVTDPTVLRNVSIVSIIGFTIGFVVILLGILNGIDNLVFMSNLIPYIVLTLGHAYLLATKAYESQ